MVNNGMRHATSNHQQQQQQHQQNELDIKSKTVETLLQPLINQLNSLTLNAQNGHGMSNGGAQSSSTTKKGRSKRAHLLVESLIEAIENFLRHGTEIAQENPELRDDVLLCINDIRATGNAMAETSRDFANDPLSAQKRHSMVNSSRDLLASIARLLSIADMIDANLLLRCIQLVQQDLASLKNSSNQDELTHHFKNYGRNLIDLTNLAGKRQADLKCVKLRDEMASARATLKKHSLKLFTTSKTLIRHPELSTAQANHEYVFKELTEAIEKIHGIVTCRITSENIKHLYDEAASLAVAFDELDVSCCFFVLFKFK